MAQTFNRRPLIVNTPSKSSVENHFFTHNNWKGLSNDKNFLTVDQETFSDCNNVYMDSEGLLKSRPSVKLKVVTVNGSELANILDVWQFGDVTLYKTFASGKFYLTFVNPLHDNALQVECEEKITPVLAEGKIFIFGESSFNYYDCKSKEPVYASAHAFVHTPVTKVVSGRVEEHAEEHNELTSSEIIRYVMDSINDYNYTLLVGKMVKVTIDNISYTIQFVENNQVVFVEKLQSLTNNNFYTYNNVKVPLISVSDANTIILSEIINGEYFIYYSSTGLLFNLLPLLNGVIGIPQISSDGSCAVCLKEDDVYIYSLTDPKQYPVWTPLIKTLNADFYETFDNLLFDGSCYIKMLSSDTFSVTCKVNHAVDNYSTVCITCHMGNLRRSYIDYIERRYAYQDYDIPVSLEPGEITNIPTKNAVLLYESERFTGVNSRIKKLLFSAYFLVTEKGEYVFNARVETVRSYIEGGEDAFESNTYNGKLELRSSPLYVMYCGNDLVITLNIATSILTVAGAAIEADFTTRSLCYFDKTDNIHNIAVYSNLNEFKTVVHTNNIYAIVDEEEFALCIKYLKNNIPLLQGLNFFGAGFQYTYWERDASGWDLYSTYVEFDKGHIKEHILNITSDSETQPDLHCMYSGTFLLAGNTIYFSNTYNYLYSKSVELLFDAKPIYANNYSLFLYTDTALYSNILNGNFTVDVNIDGEFNYIYPEHVSELYNFYFANANRLYISSYSTGDEFKWYFPKINTEQFDYNITNLHPISSTEMSIFFKDGAYYATQDEQGRYVYYKSKLQAGCDEGDDVMTSFDGKYTLFSSDRGLVAMTYQEFVASTEQSLSFLSDVINTSYTEFNTSPVKLFKYKYWIICYKDGSESLLLFDIRNNSWWPISLPYELTKIIKSEDCIELLANGNIYSLDNSELNYYDYDGKNKNQIEWFIKSQKLHLSAPNYYKHISNITLTSVLDNESSEPLDLNLTVTNYRKRSNTSDIENFMFDVDSIRVYVKKLNYSKVNEFQYLLESDDDNEMKIPLSLSSITVKYKISTEVR